MTSHDELTDGTPNAAAPKTVDTRTDDRGRRGVGVAHSDRSDVTLLMTYRFLRCGIVAATAALAVSVLFEIWQTNHAGM